MNVWYGKNAKLINEDKKEETNNYGGKGDFVLPADHKAGMQVPKGGAMCANCEFHKEKDNLCGNKNWVQWNGGDNKIPVPGDEYCCDFYGTVAVAEFSKDGKSKEKLETPDEFVGKEDELCEYNGYTIRMQKHKFFDVYCPIVFHGDKYQFGLKGWLGKDIAIAESKKTIDLIMETNDPTVRSEEEKKLMEDWAGMTVSERMEAFDVNKEQAGKKWVGINSLSPEDRIKIKSDMGIPEDKISESKIEESVRMSFFVYYDQLCTLGVKIAESNAKAFEDINPVVWTFINENGITSQMPPTEPPNVPPGAMM